MESCYVMLLCTSYNLTYNLTLFSVWILLPILLLFTFGNDLTCEERPFEISCFVSLIFSYKLPVSLKMDQSLGLYLLETLKDSLLREIT